MKYLDLFRALSAEHVRYLVVGGLAVNLHGLPRMTMEVDLVLDFAPANLARFERACADLGLQPVHPIEIRGLVDPEQRRAWREEGNMIALSLRTPEPADPAVDVLLDPPWSFSQAWGRRVIREAQGVRVAVASVPDLIAMKSKSGRPQDRSDVKYLRRFLDERKRR